MADLAKRRTLKRGKNEDSVEAQAKKNKHLDQKIDQLIKIIESDQIIENNQLIMFNFWRILRNKAVVKHLFQDDAKLLKKVLNKIREKHFKEADYLSEKDKSSMKKYTLSMALLFYFIQNYINKNEDIQKLIKNDLEFNKHFFIEFARTGKSLPSDANYDWFDSHNNSEDEKSLASTLSLLKRTALVLGFDSVTEGVMERGKDNKMTVTVGDSNHEVKISGSSRKMSAKWLNRYLDEYIKEHASDEEVSSFIKIAEATKFFATRCNRDGSSQAFYDRYKRGELTYMTSGCNKPPHAVGIAIQGDYLVYCNRGYGLLDWHKGTKIYKLKKPLDRETVRKINGAFSKSNSTIEDLHHILNNVVDLDNPIASLPSKAQEHGNCAFANPKATTEAMLVLLKNKGGDEENIKRIVNAQDKIYEKSYKNFTKHIRDRNIEELIAAAKAPKTPFSEQVLFKLIKEYIMRASKAESRSDIKAKDENNRLLTLWNGIPNELKEALSNDPGMKYFMRSKAGVRFLCETNQTQRLKEIFSGMASSDFDTVFSYATKQNRVDVLKSVLDFMKNNDTIRNNYANPMYTEHFSYFVTAELICGDQYINDHVKKIMSHKHKRDLDDDIRILLECIDKISRPPNKINHMVNGIQTAISSILDAQDVSLDTKNRLMNIVANVRKTSPSTSLDHLEERINQVYTEKRNQKYLERIKDMSPVDINEAFSEAIKANRVDIVQLLLKTVDKDENDKDDNKDFKDFRDNYSKTLFTARFVGGEESIRKCIEKFDTHEKIQILILYVIKPISESDDNTEQVLKSIQKVISILSDKDLSPDLKNRLSDISKNIQKKLATTENSAVIAEPAATTAKTSSAPVTTGTVSTQTQPTIREMYNQQRNSLPTRSRGLFASFSQQSEKNIAKAKENPKIAQRIDALQNLLNKVNSAQNGEKGQHNLEFYCALRYMVKEIKKEKNKFPSALAKVCNKLISKMENDASLNKEMMKSYCNQNQIEFKNTMDSHNIQKEHLNAIAKNALNIPSDQHRAKSTQHKTVR